MTFAERNAMFLRTCLEVLASALRPLTQREVMLEVAGRLSFSPDELGVNQQGRPKWEVQLGFRSAEAAKVGWLTKRGGWAITEAGLQALDDYPGDELLAELRRQFRARDQAVQGRQYRDPRWATVLTALDVVGPGNWTTYGDLAKLVGMAGQAIGGFMAEHKSAAGHRVLLQNGTISPDFRWWDPDRAEDPRTVLEAEGVEFDAQGRANPMQRITADDFDEVLGSLEPVRTPVKRAWLVRGSSVEGRDLVPIWLRKESMSLAASGLRVIAPPVPRAELKSFVDEDYQHKEYSAREAKLAEFDAFCNRMRAGDLVLTTTQGKAYVGRITGDAEYVNSSDQRSNLRRAVDWLNDSQPVAFNKLPDPLPATLQTQSDVVDITENLAAVETLLRELGIEVEAPTPALERALEFPPVSPDLAEHLMIEQGWLQRQADLLWNRRQLIFYGPPGTGKTYLARELAQHLAGGQPSAVKLVQFHPSYTYEDFFEGFRPKQEDKQLVFDIHKGPFRVLVDDARAHQADPYILIIDEINRANLAKVFGELYFLLEYRDDPISLLYSTETTFTLPKNVFVIGTMNTSDRSIALVDAAMRRRFAFVELHPAQPPTGGLLREWLRRKTEEGLIGHHADAADLLDALNRAIDERDFAIGPSYLMHEYIYRSTGALAEVWETSILPLLEEHHYGSPREILDRYRLDTLRKALDNSPAGPA